jgi:hypothetical protein
MISVQIKLCVLRKLRYVKRILRRLSHVQIYWNFPTRLPPPPPPPAASCNFSDACSLSIRCVAPCSRRQSERCTYSLTFATYPASSYSNHSLLTAIMTCMFVNIGATRDGRNKPWRTLKTTYVQWRRAWGKLVLIIRGSGRGPHYVAYVCLSR